MVGNDFGFQKGHNPWNKGLKGFLAGKKHYLWKGENVGYISLHKWVKRCKGKPTKCIKCGTSGGNGKGRIEWANTDRKYNRNLKDFISLCQSCHYTADKRGEDLTYLEEKCNGRT